MLLDVVEVAESHSGVNLAIAFSKILDKLVPDTEHIASNNDAMISELETMIDEFPGAINQTRCFQRNRPIIFWIRPRLNFTTWQEISN